jgi:hypothetical protein
VLAAAQWPELAEEIRAHFRREADRVPIFTITVTHLRNIPRVFKATLRNGESSRGKWYHIEAIQNVRRNQNTNKLEYVIRWLNYNNEESTWESPESITANPENRFLDEWRESHPDPPPIQLPAPNTDSKVRKTSRHSMRLRGNSPEGNTSPESSTHNRNSTSSASTSDASEEPSSNSPKAAAVKPQYGGNTVQTG